MLMREYTAPTRVRAAAAGPSTGRCLGTQGRSIDPMDHVLVAPSVNRNARSNDVTVGLRVEYVKLLKLSMSSLYNCPSWGVLFYSITL